MQHIALITHFNDIEDMKDQYWLSKAVEEIIECLIESKVSHQCASVTADLALICMLDQVFSIQQRWETVVRLMRTFHVYMTVPLDVRCAMLLFFNSVKI